MASRVPRHRGFSMLELAVALGVISILATITIIGVSGMKRRGTYATATGDIITALRRARAEAVGRGQNVIFYIDGTNSMWCAFEDTGSAFNPSGFACTNVTSQGDRFVMQESLPANVTYGPSSGYGGAFAAPYNNISSSSACSFCTSGNGYLTFQANGSVLFSGASATGGSFSVTAPSATSSGKMSMTFMIVGRNGVSRTWEKYQ